MYGLDDPVTAEFGSRCLIARRLVERGVRFVQICTGNQTWDHHNDIKKLLPDVCRKIDQPSAALVKDLKSRGLLDSRSCNGAARWAVCRSFKMRANIGRDHNTYGFSMWLAGGGVQVRLAHGATDEVGHKAVENIVTHSDYHATLLHLFGLDYNRLTYKRNGTEQSLVDGQPCRVVHDILA